MLFYIFWSIFCLKSCSLCMSSSSKLFTNLIDIISLLTSHRYFYSTLSKGLEEKGNRYSLNVYQYFSNKSLKISSHFFSSNSEFSESVDGEVAVAYFSTVVITHMLKSILPKTNLILCTLFITVHNRKTKICSEVYEFCSSSQGIWSGIGIEIHIAISLQASVEKCCYLRSDILFKREFCNDINEEFAYGACLRVYNIYISKPVVWYMMINNDERSFLKNAFPLFVAFSKSRKVSCVKGYDDIRSKVCDIEFWCYELLLSEKGKMFWYRIIVDTGNSFFHIFEYECESSERSPGISIHSCMIYEKDFLRCVYELSEFVYFLFHSCLRVTEYIIWILWRNRRVFH